MLDTSRVAARLVLVRAFADRLGLRVQLESRLAYLAKYGEPRPTRCTLYPDLEEHSFLFMMETESAPGGWAHWFDGRLDFRAPHDAHPPEAAPKFAPSAKLALGWSIAPDPVADARAFGAALTGPWGRA